MAPRNPPTTNIEDRTANSASVMGMHCGNFESGWDARSFAALLDLQVSTSWGALSSDLKLLAGM